MGVIKTLQTNLNSGELAPNLIARQDIKHYFNGLEKARNVLLLPQGGVTRRPGLEFLREERPVVSQVDLSGGGVTVTAPNGGTAGNAFDGDEATEVVTNAIGTTNPFVILHVDLGSSTTVHFADVRQLRLTTGGTASVGEVEVQHSADNAAWFTHGNAVDTVGATEINRRFSDGVSIAARYFRIVRIGSTDLTTDTFRIGEFLLWEETATLSNTRMVPFKFSTSQTYMMVVTDRNMAVYQDGVWLADIAIPHTTAQLPEMSWLQSLDNIFLFHEAVPTWNVERQGANDEWHDEKQVFTNAPTHDFGSGAEPAWSATRGYPKCGTFHGGAFWLAGTSSLPEHFWRSKVDAIFDFDKGVALDNEAIWRSLDGDDVAAIFFMNSGRHLQFFTSSREVFIQPEKETITPANIEAKTSTEVGLLGPGVRVIKVEGAVLYIEKGGSGVREFLYTDLEQAYSSQSMTLLASHLINTPVDFALKKTGSKTEGDLGLIVNADGTMAVLQTLRSQEIAGWSLWLTQGLLKAAGVDDDDDIYVSVERVIDGVTKRYTERFREDFFTDSGLQFTSGLPTDTFAGMDHLEAETVKIRADDATMLSVVVASGSVTVEQDVETKIEIGLGFPDCKENEVSRLIVDGYTEGEARKLIFGTSSGVGSGDELWVKDMPVSVELPDGFNAGDPMGVVEAIIKLDKSHDFFLGANGLPPRQVAGTRPLGDDLLDIRPALFTGNVRIDGILGSDTSAQLELTMRDPMPFTVLSIRKGVEL